MSPPQISVAPETSRYSSGWIDPMGPSACMLPRMVSPTNGRPGIPSTSPPKWTVPLFTLSSVTVFFPMTTSPL